MKDMVPLAQAILERARSLPQIAQADFITEFAVTELMQVSRTPLLLISPHLVTLTSARLRSAKQVVVNTFMVSRNRRGERAEEATLEIMTALDALDGAILDQDFDLQIQPLDLYRRRPVSVERGWSVVQTSYSTVLPNRLAESKFTFVDLQGAKQTIGFNFVATDLQAEDLVDGNDYGRTVDGSLRSYHRGLKKQFDIRFTLVSTPLKEQLGMMKQTGGEITFFRDRQAEPTMVCVWTNDFNFVEERPGYWTGSLVLREV